MAFQPGPTFVGKARSLPQRKAPAGYSTLVRSRLSCKFLTGLERLARDKQLSLLSSSSVSEEETLTTGLSYKVALLEHMI